MTIANSLDDFCFVSLNPGIPSYVFPHLKFFFFWLMCEFFSFFFSFSFYGWLHQTSSWVSSSKNEDLVQRCKAVAMELWAGIQWGLRKVRTVSCRDGRNQRVDTLHLCLYLHICFIFFCPSRLIFSAPHSTWWGKDAHPQLPRPRVVVPGTLNDWVNSMLYLSALIPDSWEKLTHLTSGFHPWFSYLWNSQAWHLSVNLREWLWAVQEL